MSDTRRAIEASWRKSRERAERDGILTATPATAAGQYLEAEDGDAERALAKVPEPGEDDRFFRFVRQALEHVIAEERAERGPRLKTGT